MARTLDGVALLAYLRRLGLPRDAQELVSALRCAPPARSPQTRHGNMAVWYPSKKMGCVIKAESAKVEFAFLLEAEHDDDVLEFYDQPQPIPLEYRDRRGRRQRPLHTADYFTFRTQSAGWEECKPVEELLRQAHARPGRYRLDERGIWRCPPGEAYAAPFGLTYRVRSADQINWAAQSNWQFLEDYYQELERLELPEAVRDQLWRLVDASPGITLAELRQRAAGISADLLYTAIAQQHLYADLTRYRLSEPARLPVYRDWATARADELRHPLSIRPGIDAPAVLLAPGRPVLWDGRHWRILNVGARELTLADDSGQPLLLAHSTFDALVAAGKIVGAEPLARGISAVGRALLDQARPADVATALYRDRVLHPDQDDHAEHTHGAGDRLAIPARTRRDWARAYRDAELRYGSGFLGLLPRLTDRGGKRKIAAPVIALIQKVLEAQYDTVTRKPKRGAYGEYLLRSQEAGLAPVSQRTFYTEVQRHKTTYEQTLAREGRRAAYPMKEYHHASEQTVPRHGLYAWSMAHLDHTELDLELCDSGTGKPLGRCWLTLLLLSHSRRLAAFSLSFDPPSYRSCMLALRLCVQRYGRLPTAITVDGGSEFRSVYFEQLLALYRVRKHQRPAAEPRFGSVGERLFGTLNTELLHHLLGNTQSAGASRTQTKATDPRALAGWTLAALAVRVRQWADEEYDTIRHPALGQSPREAYAQSLERDGERQHRLIPYDEVFRMATLPTTEEGTALVQPGRGVRINHLDYWCEQMREPVVERSRVPVRFDPADVSVGYAYINGRWRRCVCACDDFAGCSARELQLLTEAWRQRQRLQHGRAQVEGTQRQLAAFRREGAVQEILLRQQRRDREAKTALALLEGGQAGTVTAPRQETLPLPTAAVAEAPPAAIGQDDGTDDLIVLRRYRA